MIRPELADTPEFIRRFDAEAQFVARLEHPHIVPLFDYWREPGGAYLVMRYFRGGNASQLLDKQGPLSLSRVERIVDEIGGALATAHAQGVVHCDVKPANILFDDEGGSYLGDFGIATGVGASPSLAVESIASAIYQSPEQASQGVAEPGADVYAFGAVLFELLTGEAAFPGDTSIPELIEQKRIGALPKLSVIRPDLPETVDDVIRRAMAPEPDDRYADIPEMVAAFNAAITSRGERRARGRCHWPAATHTRAWLPSTRPTLQTSSDAMTSSNGCPSRSPDRASLPWSVRRARGSHRWFAPGSRHDCALTDGSWCR